MQAKGDQLCVEGLTSLQLAELRSAVAAVGHEEVTQIDPPSLGGSRAGEPGLLTAVVMVTPAVISAVALWLSRQTTARTKTFRYAKISSDGSMQTFELNESLYKESGTSPEAFLKILREKFGDVTTGEG